MRGVSADSWAASVAELDQQAESGDAVQVGQLGSDMFAVHDVLTVEPSLRRALTDPSAPTEAKTGLVSGVFSGKVAEQTVTVLETVAGQRWSSTSDFVSTVEQLGVMAYVIAADQEGQLSALEDDLFRFGRVVSANPALRDALTNKQVAVGHRQELVTDLLRDKVSAPAVRLVVQAVASRHQSLEMALEEYQKVAADRQARVVALVRSAVELTDDERTRLAAALGQLYGRDIHLNTVVDPDVLGGIKVQIGDEVIDGTVAGRLDDARRRIAG